MPTKLENNRVDEELEKSSNYIFDDKKSITNDSRKEDHETSEDESTDDYHNEDNTFLKNSQASVKFDTVAEKGKSKELPDEDDAEKPMFIKKRTKKLKKFSESRTAFDGRKVVFTTECTQTDWSWKDNAETSGTAKVLTARYEVITPPLSSSHSGLRSSHVLSEVMPKNKDTSKTRKSESRQTSGKTRSDGESVAEDRTITDLTPFSLQPNDEFGIPLSDVSSDSDTESSDIETPKKSKQARRYPPLVGPPLILKYIRESDLADLEASKGEPNKEGDLGQNPISADEAILDEYGNAIGMFSGTCEFCGTEIKPFPSLEQQLSEPPESLFCCEDYRDFVEFAMTTANRLEDDIVKRNNKISVKAHRHYGSKEARMLAKEKAVQRMHEREIQRRKQEASGLQASYQYSYLPHEDDSDTPADHQPAETETKKPTKKEVSGSKGGGGDKGAGPGDKTWRGGGGSIDLESVGGYSTHRHVPVLRTAAAVGAVGSYGGMNPEVARQMKTINYQLSSQRCLEEGWTLRVPSPLNQDDPDNETFVPEPLHPAMIASGNVQGRGIVQKFYPSGSPFLTLLPDGTGNVFYPSGRIAILITSTSLGQNTYIVLDDAMEPQMLAVFEPNGCGTCNFANGKIRLNYDQLGGIELDINGARRRSWSWKDQETHVHAPPFQPIVFGMNYFLGVRFMAQESIALSLTGKKRSCRFNVGARLKLLNSDNLPSKVNDYQLYIDERKLRIDTALSKISNLLKFPKSPKLDSMLPPLSVASRQQKLDKKRQSISTSLNPKSKKGFKQHRLPPLDQTAVTVSVN